MIRFMLAICGCLPDGDEWLLLAFNIVIDGNYARERSRHHTIGESDGHYHLRVVRVTASKRNITRKIMHDHHLPLITK